MSLAEVRSATAHEAASVVNTLTLAFAGDPFNRWYLSASDRYLNYFPKIVELLLAPAISSGTCYVTNQLEGAAMWYKPGTGPDEAALGQLFEEAPPPHLLEPVGTLLAAFENYHPHDDDCWYLPLIGVDPGHQGRGIGAALMKHVLGIIDDQHALSYLESSTPQNISLYQRHGFEVMDQLPFGDYNGLVTPMIRQRR